METNVLSKVGNILFDCILVCIFIYPGLNNVTGICNLITQDFVWLMSQVFQPSMWPFSHSATQWSCGVKWRTSTSTAFLLLVTLVLEINHYWGRMDYIVCGHHLLTPDMINPWHSKSQDEEVKARPVPEWYSVSHQRSFVVTKAARSSSYHYY